MFNGGQGWHNEWSLGPSQHSSHHQESHWSLSPAARPHLLPVKICHQDTRSITLATILPPIDAFGTFGIVHRGNLLKFVTKDTEYSDMVTCIMHQGGNL